MRAAPVYARLIGEVLAGMALMIERRYSGDRRQDARDAAREIVAGLRAASAEAVSFKPPDHDERR